MINIITESWEINGVETILFDKDGTFIDSHIYWGRIIELRVRAVMKHYALEETFFKPLCYSLGLDFDKKCLIPEGPIALLAREAVIDSLMKKLREFGVEADSEAITQIFKDVHNDFLPQIYDYVKLIDDAKDLFERLHHQNVKLAVVTSDMRANTELILEYLDLKKYFDIIIGKDDCTKAKKTGEPAKIALEKLNANPLTTISVGDASMDFEMAKNSGLKGSILVSTGQSPFEELKCYISTVVHSLKEVRINND